MFNCNQDIFDIQSLHGDGITLFVDFKIGWTLLMILSGIKSEGQRNFFWKESR